MLLVGTYIVLHQSLKAGSKPGAQWNMTRNDDSELVQVQVVLPIVLCNFIDELVIFVGFSMCNFFIFREIISNVIVERLVFLYVLIIYIYIHIRTYNIYIYTVPPGSRPNLWFLTFRLLVAHVFFHVSIKGATLTTGFVQEGVEVLSPKEILKNYLKTCLGFRWHVMSHRLKESLRKLTVEAPRISPNQ